MACRHRLHGNFVIIISVAGAWQAMCKPGGVIVYSTCTFSPEENEGVVAWALKVCGTPGKFHCGLAML